MCFQKMAFNVEMLRNHDVEMAKVKVPLQVGMFLEAVDPVRPYFFVPCEVKQLTGMRMRLSELGRDESFSFWVNKDSRLIFHCGFCYDNAEILTNRSTMRMFRWREYLQSNRIALNLKSTPANFALSQDLFNEAGAYALSHPFRKAMKLEMVDTEDVDRICVANIDKILVESVLLHFDGYLNEYDCWVPADSPTLRYAGWSRNRLHAACAIKFCPPPHYDKEFDWAEYSKETGSRPITQQMFSSQISHVRVRETFPHDKKSLSSIPSTPHSSEAATSLIEKTALSNFASRGGTQASISGHPQIVGIFS